MKKITYILSIILTSVVMVAGVIFGYSYLTNNQPNEEEANYEIVISNEVDVYYGEENKLLPYLVSNDGSVEQSRFDYVSSSDLIQISVDGDITILNVPEEDVFITISERNTGATKKIKLNVIQELQKVLGIIAPDGNLITGTQELQFGNTYPITIITEPRNISIEDYCTIKTTDANDVEHHVFDISYEGEKAFLTVVGLGTGNFSMVINNKFDESIYQTAFAFNITAEDKVLGEKILESTGKTLLSDSDMAKITTVYVDETISSLETLQLLPNLETVVVNANSLVKFANLSDSYSYRVPEDLFYDYCSDFDWGQLTHVLFPYEGENQGIYVIYHSNKADSIKYEKITSNFSLTQYYCVGYKNTAWETMDGHRITQEEIDCVEINGVHLYAIWEPITYNISYHVRDYEDQITNSIDEWNYDTYQELRTEKDFGIEVTRVGYKFVGWTDNSGATIYSTNVKYPIGEEVTQLTEEDGKTIHLYDLWKPIEYTLVFEKVEGMTEIPDLKVQYSKAYTLPIASKIGHKFIKWQLADLSYLESGVNNKILTAVDGSEIILTPIFEENNYTVKFDLDGGVAPNDPEMVQDKVVSLSYNQYYNLPLLTKQGYTTYYWLCIETGKTYSSEESFYRAVDSETQITFKAIWSAATYTINYDFNGGQIDGLTSDTVQRSWNDQETLKVPSREGYTFKGWIDDENDIYYDINEQSEWPLNLISSKDENGAIFNLKADWSRNNYKLTVSKGVGTYLTVKVDGTVVSEGEHDVPYNSNIDVSYGANEGYSNATCTFTGGRMPAESLAITSSATINTHTVSISIGTGSYMTVKIGEVSYSSSQKVEYVAYGTTISITSYGANSGYESPWYTCDYTSMPDKDITISSGASKEPSCLAKGTPILSENGNYINIEDLDVGDTIIVFDHETGSFVKSKIAYTYYAYGKVTVVTLNFSNGTTLKVLNTGHGLYDATLKQYVLISETNVSEVLGHTFISVSSDTTSMTYVTLDSYCISEELVERYDIVSENQLTHIANGFLACSDTLVGICNIFAFDDNHQIDLEAMQLDIEKYGLYTYEEWSQYVTEDEFIKFRGCFFKIAIEKGLLTEEELFKLINDIRTFSTQ